MKRLFLIAATALLAVGCKNPREEAERGKGPPISHIVIGEIALREISPEVKVIGTVTARHVSVVASGANGVVDEFLVEEGQFVKNGDELCRLRMITTDLEIKEAEAVLTEKKQKWEEMKSSRPEDVQAAHARMKAAEVTRDNLKSRLQRVADAFQKNAVNADDYDDAQEKSKAAEQLFLAAKATYNSIKRGPRKEQTEQAKAQYEAQVEQVKFLKAEKAKRTTKAPFSGYVVKEETYIGQWLSKGDPVVKLARLDEVDVVVNVDQDQLEHVQLGKNASVKIRGFDLYRITLKKDHKILEGTILSQSMANVVLSLADGTTMTIAISNIAKRETIPWSAKIVQIIPRSEWETGSRGFPVKLRLKNHLMKTSATSQNSSSQKSRLVPVLKEGMMATVSFFGKKIQAFMIPKDCLITTNRGNNIHLFTPSKDDPSLGSTIQVAVEVGVGQGNEIQVKPVGRGGEKPTELKAGQFVVTEGGERLRPVQGNVKTIGKLPSQKSKTSKRSKP